MVFPREVLAIVGETILLKCGSMTPAEWKYNEGDLPKNHWIYFELNGILSILTLFEVQVVDSGVYTCHGHDRTERKFKIDAYVRVEGKT